MAEEVRIAWKAEKVVFFLVLFAQIANILYWASRKEGYFGDELYSYQFICQTDYPSIHEDRPEKEYLNNWHSSGYFKDYFTVSEEERFSFIGVYRSIKEDVHPPLYYMLLMAVCSFFPSFTKWPVIILNIVFFILSYIILYRISGKLLKTWPARMLPCLLWGFGAGAVTTAVFGRMYMQLACFTLWFVYRHALFIEGGMRDGKVRKRVLAGIFLALVFGVLTQYYFLVFAFFLAGCTWLFLMLLKRMRAVIAYTAVMVSGLSACIFVWPVIYRQIFRDYRGVEAFGNMGKSFDAGSLMRFLGILDKEMFGGGLLLILAGMAVLFLRGVFIHAFRVKNLTDESRAVPFAVSGRAGNARFWIWFFILLGMLYIAVIAKIAPYQTDRYIFNIYAIAVLELAVAGDVLCRWVSGGKGIKAGCVAVILALTVYGYFTVGVGYLYEETGQKLEIADYYSDLPVILLTYGNRRYVSCCTAFYFLNGQEVYPIEESGIGNIGSALDDVGASSFLLYIDNSYNDIDSRLQAVKESVGAEYAEWKFDMETCSVYLVTVNGRRGQAVYSGVQEKKEAVFGKTPARDEENRRCLYWGGNEKRKPRSFLVV